MSYFRVDAGDEYEFVEADMVSFSEDGELLHFQKRVEDSPFRYQMCAAFRTWNNFQQITKAEYDEGRD